MDTNLKKSRLFLVWLAFFIGVNIVFGAGLAVSGSLIQAASRQGGDFDMGIHDILEKDYQNTYQFNLKMNQYFAVVVRNLTGDKNINVDNNDLLQLNDKDANVVYYGINSSTKKIFTNSKTEIDFQNISDLKLPESYNYCMFYDGQKFRTIKDAEEFDYVEKYGQWFPYLMPDGDNMKDLRVVILAKKQLSVSNLGAGGYSGVGKYKTISDLKQIERTHYYQRLTVGIFIVVYLISIGLIILSIIQRKKKRAFDKIISRISGWVWFEIKFILSIFLLIITVQTTRNRWSWWEFFETIFLLLPLFWWSYFMLIDLWANRQKFFTNNIISSLIKFYRKYDIKLPFQKAMITRFFGLFAAELGLILLALIIIAATASSRGGPIGAFFFLLTVGGGIYLFYRYIKRFMQTVSDIGKIVEHSDKISKGDLHTQLLLAEQSDMYKTAYNLNNLQQTIIETANENIKSERMKIELITNVSHDLKTPLTAIVNYVDLLSREELVPEHANDYVKILAQKASRLSNLTNDIFEISKAQTGNIELNLEQIDLTAHLRQTLGELDEKIKQSGIDFRVNLPENPIHAKADGNKLYRVFENIVGNMTKYSMPGTRAYIDLKHEAKSIIITFKNVASYEMDFNGNDILERFVRGDKARTSEGSGLGLAIAQSFINLCGGRLTVNIDGDLFKVTVQIPISE